MKSSEHGRKRVDIDPKVNERIVKGHLGYSGESKTYYNTHRRLSQLAYKQIREGNPKREETSRKSLAALDRSGHFHEGYRAANERSVKRIRQNSDRRTDTKVQSQLQPEQQKTRFGKIKDIFKRS